MTLPIDLRKKPFFLSQEDIEWVENVFNNLGLKEKFGQIVMPETSFPSRKNLNQILEYKPGGVFLGMGLNSKGCQRSGAEYLQTHSEIPLLIAGDLELGGLGGALNATPFSSNMGVGATNDEQVAYNFGKVTGVEGRALGYNWTFSPVVDINYNYQNPIINIRSFGDRPDLVLRMAKSYIKGVQDSEVAACAKHWPGDGLDDRDQHLVSTINSFSMEKWRASYGIVYKGLIDAGVKTVMSAHIQLPAYYKEQNIINDQKFLPASLSNILNQNLLRNELGFNGVIVSDATGMLGFSTYGLRKELVPRCIAAGCDVLLFLHGGQKDIQALADGFETGLLTENRLNEAVLRVLGLKASLGLYKQQKFGNLVLPKASLKQVGGPAHAQMAMDCAQKSITLVKDIPKILPLTPTKHKRLLLLRTGDLIVLTRKIKGLLRKEGFKVTDYSKSTKISPDTFDVAIYIICEPGFMAKNNIRIKWQKVGGVRWLPQILPTILISVANPYHLYEVPRMPTYINTYVPFPRVLDALVQKLVGKSPWLGQNPVDPFCGLDDAKI